MDRAALITGVAGQDGVYLARLLRSAGYRVTGSVLPGTAATTPLAPYLDGVDIVEADVCDRDATRGLLRRCRPDEVYNLAAMSSVGASWADRERVTDVNDRAVLQLLESLVRYRDEFGEAPRFFQASSSEIFGAADDEPQHERTRREPRSPYGESKRAAHDHVVTFRETHELFACNGILFNHESPLRPTSFVTRKITRGVAEISTGRRHELMLGNLTVRRDWGAAADYVRAMRLMLRHDAPDDYVIATGTSTSLRTFVEIAFGCAGLTDPWRYVREDPALMRPADVTHTLGDPSHAKSELGWQPTITLETLIGKMVAVDLERLRTGVEETPDYLSAQT